jgi:FlaA1/EpsC-like NDP-sugar epimerase
MFRKVNSYLAFYALSLSRNVKQLLVVLLDISFCILSVWISFYLRIGDFPDYLSAPIILAVSISISFALPIFWASGLYREIFRYNGMPALMTLTRAAILYGLIYSIFIMFVSFPGIPRTIGFIQPAVVLLMVSASRAVARLWLGELYNDEIKNANKTKVLIYGAGKAGRQLADGMANSNEMKVLGYLDDDVRLHGRVLNGLLIFNPIDLEEIINQKKITNILLAIPSASQERRNDILKKLSDKKLSVLTLPALSDIASGKITLGDVRELELDDLLGRPPVLPNLQLLSLTTHKKTVLVTGAGGSIGSELCRQVLKTKPTCLLLVEISEYALYKVQLEIRATLIHLNETQNEKIIVVPLIASVWDEVRMNSIMTTWKPDTIYHAAAYKHVPLVEHNPSEGVRNNVWGTKVCAEVAIRNGVRNFVLISTDKAVRPTNIMGATKRLSEMILQALNETVQSDHTSTISQPTNSVNRKRTCFSIVRFGNVLGSSGSVVPLFREQIKNGGPITLTHPDICRYFMTIPEAAQLVIQAGAMGSGGDVFVLKMGEPVKIYELARRIVELSGLTIRNEKNPKGDIEIKVTGLRPGEKLYEELLIGDNPEITQHPRILKAHEKFMKWEHLKKKLQSLLLVLNDNNVIMIRRHLKELVNEYQQNNEIVDWIYLEAERKAPRT